jgi:hypothetical protein
MPQPRKRIAESGAILPCTVSLTGKLAAAIYHLRIAKGYSDETQLVTLLLRANPEIANLIETLDLAVVATELLKDEASIRRAKPKRT